MANSLSSFHLQQNKTKTNKKVILDNKSNVFDDDGGTDVII